MTAARKLARDLAACVTPVEWSPELRALAAAARPVLAALENVGRVQVRVLRRRSHTIVMTTADGRGARASHTYELALVIVDGEHAPRWIASERIEVPT